MSHSHGIPLLVNPQLRPGLDALGLWLLDNHYSAHAIGRIQAHAAAEGTLAGSVYLEPGDEPEAEEVFTAALPAVPLDSEAWDRPDAFLDARMLADGTHPLPFADEPDDTDRSIPADAVVVPPELEPEEPPLGPDDEWTIPPHAPDEDPCCNFPGRPGLAALGIAPVSGGAPETYEPTPTEWSEACAMFRADDRAAEMRAWYARNPIEALNRDRTD